MPDTPAPTFLAPGAEPPAPQGGARDTKWKRMAEALRAKPGQWAVVGTYTGEHKRSRSQPPRAALSRWDDIEVTSRTVDGTITVYARAVTR